MPCVAYFHVVVDQKALIVFKSDDDAILATELIRRKFPKPSQRCMYLSRIVPGNTVPQELPWPDKQVAFKFDKHFKELFPVEVKGVNLSILAMAHAHSFCPNSYSYVARTTAAASTIHLRQVSLICFKKSA